MKKLILLGVLALAMVSCTKKPAEVIGCAVQSVVKNTVSTTIAKELTCTNVAEIEKAVEAELAKTKLCTSDAATAQSVDAKSAFGDLVCQPVVDSLMLVATQQIPAAWGCDPSAKVDTLKEKLITACKSKL